LRLDNRSSSTTPIGRWSQPCARTAGFRCGRWPNGCTSPGPAPTPGWSGYTASIDPERYGYGISAYVYLKISQHSWKAVRRQVLQIPEVWHGALVSGENDLVLLVRTQDAASMRELVLNTFQTMPDVLATQTVLILDELSGPRKTL
jgi:hypothetical protein